MNPGSIAFWNGTSPVNIDWGSIDETNHVYPIAYSPAEDGQLTFYFYDDQYGDNSGSLNVKIYQCLKEQKPVVRSAEITSPLENEHVWGSVDFTAYLIDDDEDAVQWAVRKGTCAANTGTIYGNVDNHSDDAVIDTINVNMQTFSFSGEITEEGKYCFVYNPTENNGETNIRLTREFYVDNPDDDGDGVLDEDDKCELTKEDKLKDPFESWGVHRWHFNESKLLVQQENNPGKGTKSDKKLEYTYGCSCLQILDTLKKETGDNYGGHYKFGCSTSIIDEWHNKYMQD